MARLLREIDTGLFYSDGGWTFDPRRAKVFPNLDSIEELVAKRRLEGVEMVLFNGEMTISGGFPLSDQRKHDK